MKGSRNCSTWLCAGTLSGFACASLFLVWGGCSAIAMGQNKEPAALIVACSPELPTVEPGDKIEVRAWSSSGSTLLDFTWTVTRGKISRQGSKQFWDFKGVAPGLYHATVQVKNPSGLTTECSIQVFVQEDLRSGKPPKRETGRSFLQKGETEEQGYGLYSYILFGSYPTDSVRQRYLGTIEAYLHMIPKIEDLEAYKDHNELNITFLPLDASPGPSPSAQWIIEHYDYARARILLDKLPGDHRNGPYVISTLKPLSQTHSLSGQYLFQDLSNVPPSAKDLVSWWVREFLSQAAQEDFWEERTGQQLTLRLRTTVAILAVGIPEVREGLTAAITWIH